jgi:hypothetical protein
MNFHPIGGASIRVRSGWHPSGGGRMMVVAPGIPERISIPRHAKADG